MSALSGLEKKIGYSFKDQELAQQALTHSSTGGIKNYERLEFLGDRVLGLVIAASLFEKFPEEKEGDLAKRLASLVQGETLALIAAQISLGKHIYFSSSEREAGGAENAHILADVFEALIGAMYLDGGLEPCRIFIEAQWSEIFHTMKKPPQHPKTELQEWAQGKGLPLPSYEITGQSGPDHAPVFEITLNVKGYATITAQGRSRAEAEKNAALEMLKTVESENNANI